MKTINSVLWITLFMLPSAFLFAGHPLSEINTTVKEFNAVTEQKNALQMYRESGQEMIPTPIMMAAGEIRIYVIA